VRTSRTHLAGRVFHWVLYCAGGRDYFKLFSEAKRSSACLIFNTVTPVLSNHLRVIGLSLALSCPSASLPADHGPLVKVWAGSSECGAEELGQAV
jgi:hypothetical protein